MFDQDYVSCQKEGVVERRHEEEVRDGFTSWVEMIQLSITASAQKCSKLALFLNLSNLCIRNCTRQGIENLIHGWWMLVLTKVHAKHEFLAESNGSGRNCSESQEFLPHGAPKKEAQQMIHGICLVLKTYGGVLTMVVPQIIHFNRVFHYKPSIWDTPIFGNTHITCCKSWRVWLW